MKQGYSQILAAMVGREYLRHWGKTEYILLNVLRLIILAVFVVSKYMPDSDTSVVEAHPTAKDLPAAARVEVLTTLLLLAVAILSELSLKASLIF